MCTTRTTLEKLRESRTKSHNSNRCWWNSRGWTSTCEKHPSERSKQRRSRVIYSRFLFMTSRLMRRHQSSWDGYKRWKPTLLRLEQNRDKFIEIGLDFYLWEGNFDLSDRLGALITSTHISQKYLKNPKFSPRGAGGAARRKFWIFEVFIYHSFF